MVAYREVTGQASSTPWWLLLIEGIAGLIIGVLLLTETGATLYTLMIFVGAYWFVTGIIDLVMMFVDSSQWGWKLVSGVLGILAGLIVIRHPAWASILLPATLVWILGIAGVAIGLLAIVRAFMGGGLASVILGVLSIILGGVLLFNTLFATTVLIYAVGIWAIIGGIFAIVGSFWLRSRQHGTGRAPEQQPLAPA